MARPVVLTPEAATGIGAEAGRDFAVANDDGELAGVALGLLADSTYGPALLAALRSEGTLAVQTELLDALGRSGLRPDLDRLLALALPPSAEPEVRQLLGRLSASPPPRATASAGASIARIPSSARRSAMR